MIAAFAPARGARLVRNPRFRSWSTEARPDGFPDAITVTPSQDAAAQVAAVQHGRADAIVAAGLSTVQLPLDQARALALTDASHVYTTSTPFASSSSSTCASARSMTRGCAGR